MVCTNTEQVAGLEFHLRFLVVKKLSCSYIVEAVATTRLF